MKKQTTDQQFTQAVAQSISIRETLRRLGLHEKGGNYQTFHNRVARLKLDTSHFLGQGHGKGKKRKNVPEFSVKDSFVRNGTLCNHSLKRKILRDKLIPYVCAHCGNTGSYMSKPLALHLDHKNGVSNDHRLSNLRFLCPNCHSQTDTYCGKAKGRRKT